MRRMPSDYRPGGAMQFVELDTTSRGFRLTAWDYDTLDEDCDPWFVEVEYTPDEFRGLRDAIDALL